MTDKQGFQIFHAKDAPTLAQTSFQSMAALTPVEAYGFDELAQAGAAAGSETRVLVNVPGFSLVYLWFKKYLPLPLHSHDVDCTYFVIAGSLKLGTEVLGPRDSFFVPAHAPYTYQAGPAGVEVLEIRQADHWDFRNHAKSQAFFDRALETVRSNRADWQRATRPSTTEDAP